MQMNRIFALSLHFYSSLCALVIATHTEVLSITPEVMTTRHVSLIVGFNGQLALKLFIQDIWGKNSQKRMVEKVDTFSVEDDITSIFPLRFCHE